MSPRKFQIDEITAHMINRKNICPFMTICSFLDVPQKVDFDAIRHAITHCGGSFEDCPMFIMQQRKTPTKKIEVRRGDDNPP
jgi:hypothetical protein